MGGIYKDTEVDWIQMVLTATASGGGTVTINAGTEYYEQSELYPGSPEIFPLLAESPQLKRGVGDQLGIRYDVTISLLARQPYIRNGKGLADLRGTYEFYRAPVTCKYGAKAFTVQGVSGDFPTRQIVEVIESSWDQDILVLNCRDAWFEDVEVSKRIPTSSTVADFANLRSDYIGEFGAWAFGEDQYISALIYEVDSANNAKYVFGGWNIGTTHTIKTFDSLHVENQDNDFSDRRFLTISPTTPVVGTNMITGQGGGSYFHLGQFWRSLRVYSSTDCLLSSIQLDLAKVGSPTAEHGELQVELYRGEALAGPGTVVPTGSPLGTVTFDYETLITNTGHATKKLAFDYPVPILGGVEYVLVVSYSNKDEVTNYYVMSVLGGTAQDHYALDRSSDDRGWEIQSGVRMAAAVYSYALSSATQETDGLYAWNKVTIVDTNNQLPLDKEPTFDSSYNLKLKVDGLDDDGSGTFTGTANAIMKRPADITKFILNQFVGISTSLMDTTSFTDARNSQDAEGYTFGFVIEEEIYAEELLTEILKQSRTVLYKNPSDGKYKLYFWEPSPVDGSVDIALNEQDLFSELDITAIQDEPTERVFNDFLQSWGTDPLETPKDPALLRKANTDKYKFLQFLNGSDSTASDAARELKLAYSETLYGKRRVTFPLTLHTVQTAVQNFQNYLADRFYQRQKVVTVTVPRRKYYLTADLFDSVKVKHSSIHDPNGYAIENAEKTASTTGLSIADTSYPNLALNLGSVKGRITGIAEIGSEMQLTILTDNGPGSY